MKKTFKSLFLSMLAIAAFASCEKEPEGEGGGQKADGLTILAVTDGTLVPAWTAGDEIKVAVDSKSYDFTATTAGKSAKFTDDGSLTAEIIANNPVSAYYNCSSARGAFRISGEQTYRDGKSSAAIPMYAYTMNAPANNTLAMTFKPLASVLRVTLPIHPISVETITVRAAEGATVAEGAIAGTYVVNAAEGTVSVNADAEGVEMTFATPLDITQGGTVDIPVGWFAVNGGLEIVLGYESTKEMKFVVGAEGSFKSYSDADGFKAGAVVPVEFEMDVNSFPRAYFVTANAPATGKGQSWSEPATLDYALSNAMAGSTIHVAAGTYNPTKALPYVSEEEIAASEALLGFEVKNNVTIIGGYPAAGGDVADASVNKTILDGNNKSWHVLVVGAAKIPGEKVVIKGITVTKGYNTDTSKFGLKYGDDDNGFTLAGDYGAGLALVGTEVDLDNVIIDENNGHSAAGLFCIGSKVNMTGGQITNNTSTGNGAGAWLTTGSDIVMDGTIIQENKATGDNATAGGLYLYVGEGAAMKANIKNVTVKLNEAKNVCGLYIRDESAANLLESTFTGCTFEDNKGADGVYVLNATTSFTNCEIKNHTHITDRALECKNAHVTFKKCKYYGNTTTANGFAYLWSDASDSKYTMDECEVNNNRGANGIVFINSTKGNVVFNMFNSVVWGNTTTGRASGLYVRNDCAKDAGTVVTANCVNTTISGNSSANFGSGIHMYTAKDEAVTVNLISCTVSGNSSSHASQGGAIGMEKQAISTSPNFTLNTYNTIIAGNKLGENESDICIQSAITNAKQAHKYTFIGSEYYDAAGTVAAVTPAFDYKTMLGALNGGVMKLIGAASANPAVGNGMPAADLKALTLAGVSADVLGKDQNGAARSGSVAGACVTQ